MFNLKSVRSKLILSFVSLILIPSVIISIVLYKHSKNIVQQKIALTIIDGLEQKAKEMDDVFQGIYYRTVSLSVSEELINNINNINKDSNNRDQFNRDVDEIYKQLLKECNANRYIDSFYVYVPSINKVLTTSPVSRIIDTRNTGAPGSTKTHLNDEQSYFSWISVDETKDILTSSNKNYFSITKSIRRPTENKDFGFISANINERVIYFNLLSSMIGNNDNVLMLNPSGIVVSNEKYEELGIDMSKESYISNVLRGSSGYFIENIQDKEFMIAYITTKLTGYKIVYMVPLNQLTSEIDSLKGFIFNVSFVLIIISLTIGILFSMTMYKPLWKLKVAMEEVGTGNFDVRISDSRRDEFGILNNGFNNMTSDIKKLIDEVYTQKLLKKEAELHALQSQITPHFLYNTLNSIRCVALLQNSTEISNMLSALIELLQLSAGKKSEFITIEEEVKQVKNYILLQKFRYRDLFDVSYDIDESILNYKVPKLILQPLVENSIKHGISLRSGEGKIVVRAVKQDNSILLEVEDNGVGMPENRMKEILNQNDDNGSGLSGIGVSNVNDRIRLYYGENYGLSYETNKNNGATAKIVIPISC